MKRILTLAGVLILESPSRRAARRRRRPPRRRRPRPGRPPTRRARPRPRRRRRLRPARSKSRPRTRRRANRGPLLRRAAALGRRPFLCAVWRVRRIGCAGDERSARRLHAGGPRLVRASFPAPTRPRRRAGRRSSRALDAAPRADRLGQDARRVPRGDRPADVRARAARSASAAGSSTSRRSRRSRSTSSATCARRSPASRAAAERLGVPLSRARRSRAHRRHAGRASARASPRTPPDILITTPESLYLLLTSQRARDPRARSRR